MRRVYIGLLVTFFWLCLAVSQVYAAQSAGNSYMRASRMQAGQAPGSMLVVFTTSSTTFTETTFRVTLDSEWVSATNFSTTASNYTVSTTGLPVGVTALPADEAKPTTDIVVILGKDKMQAQAPNVVQPTSAQ